MNKNVLKITFFSGLILLLLIGGIIAGIYTTVGTVVTAGQERTFTRLLDEYEHDGRKLPRLDSAALIIDEHCDIDSRQVFDQDNKGWKAIPNALKGRVIQDDDQHTLSVCLLSTLDDNPACHIYLLPQAELGDFFAMRQGAYPLFP